MTRVKLLAPVLALMLSPAATAQDADPTPGAILGDTPYVSPSCAQADHHEFDFLNGTWDMKVMVAGRWQLAGSAVQKPALGGCASLMAISFARWGDYYRALTARDGFAAILISSYDSKARNWRQVWVDDMGGMITNLRGRKYEDGMRLVGHAPGRDGAELQRHEWKIISESVVEFTFEQSLDGGKNWSMIGRTQLVRRP
ncbi:MAG: DUF1579 domain-containing protein [Alphaproteobacteria bacterium]|nr:MAG: DUF1579 domain-containing protein [Alphaproteobacteria bacterium]